MREMFWRMVVQVWPPTEAGGKTTETPGRHDSMKLMRILLCPGQSHLRPVSGSGGATRSFPVPIIHNEA